MDDKNMMSVEEKEKNYYNNGNKKVVDFLIGFFGSIFIVAIAGIIATSIRLPYGVLIGFAIIVALFIVSIRILRRSKRRMIGVGATIPASMVLGIGSLFLLVLGACSVIF